MLVFPAQKRPVTIFVVEFYLSCMMNAFLFLGLVILKLLFFRPLLYLTEDYEPALCRIN